MEEMNWSLGRCKGVWSGVKAVSTLRDDLTFIVSVSLRKCDVIQ